MMHNVQPASVRREWLIVRGEEMVRWGTQLVVLFGIMIVIDSYMLVTGPSGLKVLWLGIAVGSLMLTVYVRQRNVEKLRKLKEGR